MATIKNVYNALDRKAPFATQMDFDNAGFLVGRSDTAVSRILVTLDITEEVIQEAVRKGANLIVAHHPIIWGSISTLTDDSSTGSKVLQLAENRIGAICAHTNLDAAEGGVNSRLAELLGLTQPIPLHTDGLDGENRPYGIGRVGILPDGPVSLEAFTVSVKAALRLSGIRVMNAGCPVYKVAVGGGACGSMLKDVAAQGCDTFVTSELKHDVYLEGKYLGVNLLDAGHYSTETMVCPVLAAWLREAFPDIPVEVAEHQCEVFENL